MATFEIDYAYYLEVRSLLSYDGISYKTKDLKKNATLTYVNNFFLINEFRKSIS